MGSSTPAPEPSNQLGQAPATTTAPELALSPADGAEWGAASRWCWDLDGTARVESDNTATLLEAAHPVTDRRFAAVRLSSKGSSTLDPACFFLGRHLALEFTSWDDARVIAQQAQGIAVRDSRWDDYIYDLAEQVSLKGSQFARRRTYLRGLQRRLSERFSHLDLTSSDQAGAVLELARTWQHHRGGDSTFRELVAIERALVGSSEHGIRGIGLWADGRGYLESFALYAVHGEWAQALFVKARTRSSDLYAGAWQNLFEASHEAGAEFLNGEYDAGLDGLKHFKRALRPTRMLLKGSVIFESLQLADPKERR